jgi:integrase
VTAVKLYRENNARNRRLSAEEKRLFDTLPVSLRPLVMLALQTGMRRDELRDLRADFQTGTRRIKRDRAEESAGDLLESAPVVSAALVVSLLAFGAGTRWEYWWAFTAALYVIGIAAG